MEDFDWKKEFIPSSIRELVVFFVASTIMVGVTCFIGFINL